MGKAFSIQGEVQLDTQGVKADLASLEKTHTKIPLAMDAREAKRQAEAMLSLVDRMDRKVVRPKIDTTSIRQAKDAVTNLDKAWDRVASGQKAKLQQLAGAFSVGQSMGYGGIGNLAMTLPALSGAGAGGLLAAAGGVAAGALASAGIGEALATSVNRAMQQEKLESFLGRAYKDQAAGFVAAAEQMAEATGFLTDDFMRAALIGKTLVNNYGLQTEQVQRLVEVSADLAATSPYEDIQTVANAMERVQSAVRGEAEASERLGLTLNDTYMKNIAFGGSLKDTWEKLSDAEKAQYRYMEILEQTKDVLGAAKDDTGLSAQLRKTKAELAEVGTAIVADLIPPLTQLLGTISDFLDSVPPWVWQATGEIVTGALTGESLGSLGTSGAILQRIREEIKRQQINQQIPAQRDVYGNVIVGASTTIVVEDRTTAGIRVQDARSFAPSNV